MGLKEKNGTEEMPSKTPIEEEIPTFKGPEDDGIPTFNAPKDDGIPTFNAPKDNSTGECCHHHPGLPAVAHCARCGNAICKDCAEACAVSGGEYGGKNLCSDCCTALFEEDKQKLKADKNSIMVQYILTIIGVIIGAAFGASSGGAVMVIACAMIGGSFLAAFKPICSALGDWIKGVFDLAGGSIGNAIGNFIIGFFNFVVIALACTVKTIIKLVRYTIYLIKASKAIKQDMEALQQIRDFMAYMDATSKNKGVDLDTLMQEGSELYNNSYAKVLKEDGEQAADQMLRRATTIIAENGEIIRNFAVA